MCRKEIDRAEEEIKSNQRIILEYKDICKNYQNKFEEEQRKSVANMSRISDIVQGCDRCAEQIKQLVVDGPSQSSDDVDCNQADRKINQPFADKIVDLEQELVKTKLALAQAEDRNAVSGHRYCDFVFIVIILICTAFGREIASIQFRATFDADCC